jgi:hypothetical protein
MVLGQTIGLGRWWFSAAVGLAQARGGDGEKFEGGQQGWLYIGEGVWTGSRQRPESSPQPNRGLVLDFIAERTEFNFWFIAFLRLQVSSDGIRDGGACTKRMRSLAGSRRVWGRGGADVTSPTRAGGHGGAAAELTPALAQLSTGLRWAGCRPSQAEMGHAIEEKPGWVGS